MCSKNLQTSLYAVRLVPKREISTETVKSIKAFYTDIVK